MKKYILLLIVFLFSFTFLCGCTKEEQVKSDIQIIKDRGFLIAGVKEDSPPFGYTNSKGELEGIDIELAKYIASSIFGYKDDERVRFVPVSPQNRIAKLNSKEVDILVATMSINDKRKLVINFSTPYFSTNQKLLVRADSKIKHIYYFNKKGRLCVILGSTGEKISRLITPTAYIVGAKTYPEAYKMLKKGQIDGILGDDCILEGINNGNPKYKLVNKSYSQEFYGVATRKSEESKELLQIINQAVNGAIDNNIIKVVKKNKLK